MKTRIENLIIGKGEMPARYCPMFILSWIFNKLNL